MLEWLILRYCIFERDSVATRHNIIFIEKLPEKVFVIVNDADVRGEAAPRVVAAASGMSASCVTH